MCPHDPNKPERREKVYMPAAEAKKLKEELMRRKSKPKAKKGNPLEYLNKRGSLGGVPAVGRPTQKYIAEALDKKELPNYRKRVESKFSEDNPARERGRTTSSEHPRVKRPKTKKS